MSISGRSQVSLSGITITGGDNSATGVGGGINFTGTGKLALSSSIVTNNRAGYGAGINFRGTGSGSDKAELQVNYDTQVTNNTATTSGGGIRVEGNALLRIVDDQVWIARNHADGGYGGGVQVIGPAEADIGSPGYRFAEYLALF
jgi:predicted outer membrane repeat protein